jgi:hypothetical protein
MSTTYLELQAKVSEALQDPDNATFGVEQVKAMIDAAWAEISRIAPQRFQEDIDPIADTSAYLLRQDDFPGEAVDEIEVQKVELWDTTGDRPKAWRFVEPMSAHPTGLTYTQAGWFNWGGTLTLPDRAVDMLDPDRHLIRVWGYSPWPRVVDDSDVIPFGQSREQAVILYCHIEALRRLTSNRTLFTQWQTRSNNTDVSIASLMSDLNIAQEEWRRRSRAIFVIREAP